MGPVLHQLPKAAAAAFLDVAGGTIAEAGLSRGAGLKVDQEWQTLILEPAKGAYVLRLARDCPFDEISPAYLVLFVRRLCELCPGIDIAHRIQCGHPIVASVSLALSERATQAEWQAALAASLPMLEEALGRQSEAAERFHDERPRFDLSEPWPAVEVSVEQLRALAVFAEAFEVRLSDPTIDSLERTPLVQEFGQRLEEHLTDSGLLYPDRDWTAVLLRPELGMGFMDNIHFRQMDASQIIAILNAVIQGGRYSETLPRRAFGGPMVLALLARAKELAG
jgi:hypothetical protein